MSSLVSNINTGYRNNVAPYVQPIALGAFALVTAKLTCEAVASGGIFSGLPGAGLVASFVPSIVTRGSILSLLPVFVQNHSNWVLLASAFATANLIAQALLSTKEARFEQKFREHIRNELQGNYSNPKDLDMAVERALRQNRLDRARRRFFRSSA